MRMPRNIRGFGIALRMLIRSISIAAEALLGVRGKRFHRPQPMLKAQQGRLGQSLNQP